MTTSTQFLLEFLFGRGGHNFQEFEITKFFIRNENKANKPWSLISLWNYLGSRSLFTFFVKPKSCDFELLAQVIGR